MGHIGASRFLQSISSYLKLPFHLDKLDPITNTPRNAIIAVTIICLLGLLLGNLENSVVITNITTMILFFLVNTSAILLRINQPDRERKFSMPGCVENIPIPSVIGAVSSALLGLFLITKPRYFKDI